MLNFITDTINATAENLRDEIVLSREGLFEIPEGKFYSLVRPDMGSGHNATYILSAALRTATRD